MIVRRIASAELPALADALSSLLVEQVDAGASLGFLPPLGDAAARAYWRSLGPEISSETRLLVAAFDGEALAGTGQLVLPSLPNARHRAEVQKVMVAARVQRRGVGRALMSALHEEARARGRSLLLLNTKRGEPPRDFYARLGYREVGVVPGYTVDAAGARHDTVIMYRELS